MAALFASLPSIAHKRPLGRFGLDGCVPCLFSLALTTSIPMATDDDLSCQIASNPSPLSL
jgi:hypothetical protein